MPKTLDEIKSHFEDYWATMSKNNPDSEESRYQSAIVEEVQYPIYRNLVTDLRIKVNGGNILDVGSGSGRWVKFFLDNFKPASIMGVDFAQSSVELLNKWFQDVPICRFHKADITDPNLDLGHFDLINIIDLLFNLPDTEIFRKALQNIHKHLAPNGRAITTEFLPHNGGITPWVTVHGRKQFEYELKKAGLRIVAIRGAGFFTSEPFGLEPSDKVLLAAFDKIFKNGVQLIQSAPDQAYRKNIETFLIDIDNTLLAYCQHRLSPSDLPSRKFVVLARI